jgi:hypothetical protein
LVRDEKGEPATRSDRVMTRSERLPVFIGERIG